MTGTVKTGTAYVYSLNEGGGGNWGLVGSRLVGSTSQSLGKFGFSVAVAGDTIVVGAPDQSIGKGAAYVFQPGSGGNWVETKILPASGLSNGDHFGYAVATSGDTIVVGAPDKNSSTGSAYVFSRNQGGMDNWGQTKILTTTLPLSSQDEFGFSVAISGDIAVVGAPGDNSSTGAVYIFSRDKGGTDNWGQVLKISADDGEVNEAFGISAGIDGRTIVVGAPEDDINLPDDKIGSAYVFEQDTVDPDIWTQVKKLLPMKNGVFNGVATDSFGTSVSISKGTIIVGSPLNDERNFNAGAVYLYNRDAGGTGNWGDVAKLIAGDTTNGDFFGTSVAIDGPRMVVGAPFHKNKTPNTLGAAYLFGANRVLHLPIITR